MKNISGELFRKMIICGARNLEVNKDLVDSLNVFPVPDGDTGSNMYLTILSAVKEVNAVVENDIVPLADALAKGALKGARGNSGVILSQILKGFSSVLKEDNTFTTRKFANALKSGTEVAYSAVTKPKEGTILTVVRVVAEHANSIATKSTNFLEFLQSLLSKGEEILNETPEMLPVLKKAGVVDAGGKGLLCILSGFYNAIAGIDVPDYVTPSQPEIRSMGFEIELSGEIEFGYCTEFFIQNIKPRTTEVDIDKLREKLLNLGDSVIAIGDLNLIKVHIHTNTPNMALQFALELGDLDKVKIENMREQQRQLIAQRQSESKDLGMVSVCAGSGLADIFRDILVDYVIEGGQTMNPSVDDIVAAVGRVNAREIFIFPNNRNIILAAEQAKNLVDKTLYVIPTTEVPEGISAALAFNPEASAEENVLAMTEAIGNIKCAQVTYAVRSTSLDGFDLSEGDIIGLHSSAIVSKGSTLDEVVIQTVAAIIDDSSEIVTLYYGEGIDEDQCDELIDKLSKLHPSVEFAGYLGAQPHYYYFIAVE